MRGDKSKVEPSTEAASKSIADATGTAYGGDAVSVVMAKCVPSRRAAPSFDLCDPLALLMCASHYSLRYDKNGDGVFQVEEVRDIVQDVMAQRSLNKQLKKSVCVLLVLIFALLGVLGGISIGGAIVGGEAIKESKVPDCSTAVDDPRYAV